MRRNLAFALASLPLTLAACGTPQEQCIRGQTREYRVVSDLLAEVEGNLARGYAWRERTVTRSEFGTCRRVRHDKDGNPRFDTEPCWRDVTDTERFRVVIDPAVETRKRDHLAERKAALAARAASGVTACRATYPE